MIRILAVLLAFLLFANPALAAIVYVGSQSGTTVGITSALTVNFALTGGSDAAPLAGDFVVATWCTTSNVDKTISVANTGATPYTLIGSELFANDGNATNLRQAYRVMPGTTETQIVFSESGVGGTGDVQWAGAYHIFVLRNVHATPLEQAAQQGTGTNTRIIDPGSITPTTAGTYVLTVGCAASTTGGTVTSSDLTDFRAVTVADTQDMNLGGGYTAWSSGTLSPATFGSGGTDTTNDSYTWSMAAFAPAAEASNDGGTSGAAALFILGIP